MHIAKAIELLEYQTIPLKTASDHDLFDAIKLGIEALKRHKLAVDSWHRNSPKLLQGETND